MFGGKTVHLALSLVLYSSLTVFGQWTAAISGTTNSLNGAYLLDSGVGFVVGDAGTIVKTTNAGMTWSPLTSGTTNALHDVYFFDATQGVAVGEQGLIIRTTDGGAGWQDVTSGVTDTLRSVSFSGVNGISGGDSQTILYSTDAGASWQISQSGFFGGGFSGAQMLSATVSFVGGQNSIFQSLLGASTDGGASWAFQPFTLIKTKAVALTCSSSTKTPALFQERSLMDAAPSPERLMVERIGQRYSSIRRSKELIFHSQPAGLRWAQADESHTARTLELPGPTRPVGPPPISTTFPSPATRCEGSQLATAARFSGQQTEANRGRHLRLLQQLVRHPVLHQPLRLA